MKSYKILIVTDAWHPQVNGVVTTLSYLVEELKKQNHEVFLITPNDFITIPCPTYPEIKLSINAYPKVYKKIKEINDKKITGSFEISLRKKALKHNNFILKYILMAITPSKYDTDINIFDFHFQQ